MLILSTAFVLFTVIVFGIYYIPQLRNYQVYILIIASLFFYYYNNPLDVIILLISIAVNTIISYEIHMHKRHALLFAVLGIVANVLILSLFKYNSIISHALSLGQISSNKAVKHIAVLSLPLGISYFTFQGISLLVDSYRQTMGVTDETIRIRTFSSHFINSALFLSFFPKQSSGPIITAHKFFPQLEFKFFQTIDWQTTFKYIIGGLFLKFVIADNLKDYTFWMRYPEFTVLSSIDLIMLMYGYAFQFFADFAGYSLVAIGIGYLFGYTLPINFNYPYIATSCSDFWSRWHMSLSSWLRDYLYIPLGGNRKGTIRTSINLLLVMLIAGAWHGGTLNFLLWGIWHGIGLAAGRILKRLFGFRSRNSPLLTLIKIIIIFHFVSIGWLFFKLPEAAHVYAYIASISKNIHIRSNMKLIIPMVLYSSLIVIYHAHYFVKNSPKLTFLHRFDFVLYGLLLFLILLNKGDENAFIYFQF